MRDIFRRRRMWRPRPELKDSYDVVIIGGGSHGLAAAYYLGREHGISNVAVLDERGEPIGQVTSARHSRQLGHVIGMAWVPAGMASDGAAITISDDSRRLRAEVMTRPFYDPDGEVLRA